MNVNMRRGRNDDRGNPKYWGRNLAQCHSVHHQIPFTFGTNSNAVHSKPNHSLPSLLTYLLTYLLTHSLTHSLTQCSRVVLQKLTGFQLVKKFTAFHGTRRFITAFTIARHFAYPEPARSSQYPIARLWQWRKNDFRAGALYRRNGTDQPTISQYAKRATLNLDKAAYNLLPELCEGYNRTASTPVRRKKGGGGGVARRKKATVW